MQETELTARGVFWTICQHFRIANIHLGHSQYPSCSLILTVVGTVEIKHVS